MKISLSFLERYYWTRTRVFVRKYVTCAIVMVSVEDLRESKFEALALYCKSFAKLDYPLWHKSYSWLLLLLSWRKILAQKWKYLKISERFSQPFLISSLSLTLSVSVSLFLSLRGITTRNIQFIQLREIEFPTENSIRNC